MAKWIRQDNMDKAHGFCHWMVKYQGNAGAKGIGAQYVIIIIGDGPSADSDYLEIDHGFLRAKQSFNKACINSGIIIFFLREKIQGTDG